MKKMPRKPLPVIKNHKAFKIGHAKADSEEKIRVKAFDGSIINL